MREIKAQINRAEYAASWEKTLFDKSASSRAIAWAITSYLVFWMIYTINDIPMFLLSVIMKPELKKWIKSFS